MDNGKEISIPCYMFYYCNGYSHNAIVDLINKELNKTINNIKLLK